MPAGHTRLSCSCAAQQVVGYITGTVELVTNLPSELAAFPGQVRCCPSQMVNVVHALPACMPSLLAFTSSAAHHALARPSHYNKEAIQSA